MDSGTITRSKLDEFFARLTPGDDGADVAWEPARQMLETPGTYLTEHEGKAIRLVVTDADATATNIATNQPFPPLMAAFASIPIDQRRADDLVRWAH